MAATFELVDLEVNEGGWGPINLPTHLLDAPYAPFSKGDKLGRVADWSGFGSDARAERIYSTGVLNQTFSLFQQDDSFQLVDNAKAKTSFQGFKNTRQPFNKRDFSKTTPAGQKTFQKLSAKPKANKTRTFNKRNTNWNTPSKIREPSVEVKPEWKAREELDFNRLSKVTFDVPKPVEVKLCGSVGEYQRNFDRITIKTEKLFTTTTQILNSSVSTSDDPVIQQLAKTEAGVNVYGTDTIIALLMSAPRSVYPWDIIINRVGDKVFFDKRDRSQIDLSTVNENNPDPTPETEGPNSADALAREATSVNNSFIQQTVNFKTGLLSLPERPPFDEEGHPKGYRYRKFKLDDKITILLRTEFDAFIKGSPNSFITLKTLLEFDHKAQNNWRVKLDSQRGAIFAVEMKANINKLTRWTAEALLSGVDHIKLGYVSRTNPRSPTKHGLLTTQVLKPSDFATQINFSIANGWGIIKAICDSALALPEGKYLLLKDPNKAVMRFYEIPRDSFEEVIKEGKAEAAEGEEQPIEEEIDE